jgi:hypothetical protein
MDKNKSERGCYEWQISNLKSRTWAKKLNEELDKIGLGHILARSTEE